MNRPITLTKAASVNVLDAVLYPNPDDPGDPNNPNQRHCCLPVEGQDRHWRRTLLRLADDQLAPEGDRSYNGRPPSPEAPGLLAAQSNPDRPWYILYQMYP